MPELNIATIVSITIVLILLVILTSIVILFSTSIGKKRWRKPIANQTSNDGAPPPISIWGLLLGGFAILVTATVVTIFWQQLLGLVKTYWSLPSLLFIGILAILASFAFEDALQKWSRIGGIAILVLSIAFSGFGAATARWTENLEHSVATGDWGAPKESTPSFARPNRNDLGMLEPITLNPGQHSVAIRDYKGRPLCWDEVVEGPIFQVHSRKRGGEWKRFLQSEISEIRFYLPQRAYGQAIIQVERKLTKPGVGCS